MSLRERLKLLHKSAKKIAVIGGGLFIISYQIHGTCRRIDKIVNTSVLDREQKKIPEYIYIDDPSYALTLKKEIDRERGYTGFLRLWKSLKHSLQWRLLWLCRHGNREQRNVALEKLAAFRNNKHWDCLKLAQAMDAQTAVLLARTRGADLRYFLPPPLHVRRAALTNELLSFKLLDMIYYIQSRQPHRCIKQFLSKYLTNVQDHVVESDCIPPKPDSITEHDLCVQCLDAIHHHISLFYKKALNEDISSQMLIKLELLPRLAELMCRYRNDFDLDYAVVRILSVLSVHHELLPAFFQNGLVRELARLMRSSDVKLASSAAMCLANLSGENCYRPGLFLLHPLYRTTIPHTCDTLLVHGLRGSVFVTWRQRDRKCAKPVGLVEVKMSDMDCENEKCKDEEKKSEPPFIDPEIKEVIKDLEELEEQSLLSDYEVVLHDIPTDSLRDATDFPYTASNKYDALIREEADRCSYTFCWPKDWLPQDCDNLRILGVNYWSSLSEWLEKCPLQTAEISERAEDLGPALLDAGVGKSNTPIVWLAHSMGGLIVKQMLIEAVKSDNPDVKRLCENTKSFIFFSTPHKGSSLAAMPRTAAAILWPSNDVRQLEQNHPILLDLNKTFIEYADLFKWEMISFVETKPTLITAFNLPVQFVTAASADINRGVLYQLPLDHLSICKPATRQSILYTTVLDVIQRATGVKNLQTNVNNRNYFIQMIVNFFWYIFGISINLSTSYTEDVDETSLNLKWIDRIVLNAFTDF